MNTLTETLARPDAYTTIGLLLFFPWLPGRPSGPGTLTNLLRALVDVLDARAVRKCLVSQPSDSVRQQVLEYEQIRRSRPPRHSVEHVYSPRPS